MPSGNEISLDQFRAAVSGMKNNPNMVIKDNQVVEGTTYNNRTTRWLKQNQTSKSNTEIWDAFKTAMNSKFDTAIVSRVMPESGFDKSKPLPAMTIKEIIDSADKFEAKASQKKLDDGAQVKVGDRVFTKPDEAPLWEMINRAKDPKQDLRDKNNPGDMKPEEANRLMNQITNSKRAIVEYFGISHLILPEESGKPQRELEKDWDKFPLANLPPEHVDMVTELRSLVRKSQARLDEHAAAGLVKEGRSLQTQLAGQNSELAPKDIQKLIGQVANAKQAIVNIFQKKGMIPDDLDAKQLLREQSQIEGLDLKKLPVRAQKQVGELRDLIADHMHLLNRDADTKNPHVILYQPTGHLSNEELKEAFKEGRDEVPYKLSEIIPKEVKTGNGLEKLSDDASERAMDRVAYNFDQLLKQNPDIRLAFGVMSGNKKKDVLKEMLKETRLQQQDKDQLQERLGKLMDTHIPRGKNVKKSARIGEGAMGTIYEGTFNGKKVVVKELNDATISMTNVQRLIQEASIQGRGHEDPHIPKIIGIYFDSSKKPHVVMEQVPGKDLYNTIRETNGRHDTKSRIKVGLHFMSGIIKGLAALHEKNLAHLDMKTQNVMVDKNTLDAKLIDFGFGGPPESIPENIVFGTPEYISPEMANRGKTPHLGSDVYALGMMLYEMVAGQLSDPMLDAKTVNDKLLIVENGDPGDFEEDCWINEDIDMMAPVVDFIQACWKRDPNERPTAEQLLQAVSGKEITPAEPGKPGLKENLEVLDILKPDNPLRQDGRRILTGWLK